MHLRQICFENIVAKEEIPYDEQFLILQQCFQFYSNINLLFKDIFLIQITYITLFLEILWEKKRDCVKQAI